MHTTTQREDRCQIEGGAGTASAGVGGEVLTDALRLVGGNESDALGRGVRLATLGLSGTKVRFTKL